MIVIGLTGSIGMGKSTTAAMFRDAGVPVHDSDETVHRLYRGAAVEPVARAFPGVLRGDAIDRDGLASQVLGDREKLKLLESIVHPLVRAESNRFLAENRTAGTPMVVLDIPLLFETGAEGRVDRIVVVSAPAALQRERVMARPGMTEEKFAAILAKQVPDEEKRRRADNVIDTGRGLAAAREQVADIITVIDREQAGQKSG